MKKFLLSAIAVCGIASVAMAEDYPLGSLEAPLSVNDIITQGAPAKGSGIVGTFVKGYIVGDATGMNLSSGLEWEAPFTSTTNFLLAASSSETDATRCIPVALPAGAIRDALNLNENPDNVGHCIILEGSRETYFSVPGLKSVTSYQWVGEAPTPGGGGEVNPPVVSNHIYEGLTASSYTDWTIDNGDLAEGISYVWKWDSSYNYMKASAYVSGTRYATSAKLISPVIDLTNYKDCELSATSIINYANGKVADFCKTYVQAEGEEPVQVDVQPMPVGNTWSEKIEGKASLKDFDGKKIQVIFNYISTTSDAATWEVYNVYVDGTAVSAVSEISVEEGEAVYFNLQGVQVANPENGIYVKVANGKATKVVVK